MSDVQETLQQLVKRRLREMGEQRGRDEPVTLAEAFRRIEKPEVTYELVRRVEKDGHSHIGDKAVRTIAAMLNVDENAVRAAARQRPALGRFELPSRADKLEEPERSTVLSVIDAILNAAEGSGRTQMGEEPRSPVTPLPTGPKKTGPAGARSSEEEGELDVRAANRRPKDDALAEGRERREQGRKGKR